MSYWAKRNLKAQEKISGKTVKQINAELQRLYGRASRKVIDDFEATYNKILATIEAGKTPTPADLYKLDKYWEAQAQMRQELRKLGDKEILLLSAAFETNFFEVYYSIEFPEDMTAFNTVDKAGVRQLINSIWCSDGKSWSQRIWDNTEYLAQTLNDELIHIIATGKKTTDLKNILQERFNVSYRRANMLVRTEVAHIQTQAAAQRYQDYGLDQYEILGNTDDSCGNHSVDCHKMDGKKFYYKDMKVGKNAPPFHPNCKCSIVPVIN